MAPKMRRKQYDLPCSSFPYRISYRLNIMSLPRRQAEDLDKYLPERTETGVRKSALRGRILRMDRLNDCALPYQRRLILIKRLYKNIFSKERLRRIDRMIEACNATPYAKMANCNIDLRRQASKKKHFTDSEWAKHMTRILEIAKPIPQPEPEPIDRGPRKKLEELMPRIEFLATPPACKLFKRLSQESWYRDPYKVSSKALKHVTSEREKILAKPRPIPAD